MMLSHTLKHAVDTAMVGRLGVSEQAAVGLAGTVIWTIATFVAGLADGGTTMVAQATGSGDRRLVRAYAHNALWISLSAALPFALIGVFSKDVFALLSSSAEVQRHASAFSTVLLVAYIGPLTTFGASAYFRGSGDTKTPMKVAIAANVLNLALNYVFIFGALGVPGLGVEGSALATAIAGGFEGSVLLALAARRLSASEGSSSSRPSAPLLARLFRVGLPIGVTRFVEMSSYTAFTVIIGISGDVHLAASQVMVQVTAIAFMPGFGVSIATQSLVGQSVGAGRIAAARRFGWVGACLAGAFMGSLGIAFLAIPRTLAALFQPDREVIRLAAVCLRIGAIYQLFDGTQMALSGALRGAGDTKFPMYATVLINWVIFVPLTYFLAIKLGWGVVGGWTAMVALIILLAVVFARRWSGPRWTEFRLVAAPGSVS